MSVVTMPPETAHQIYIDANEALMVLPDNAGALARPDAVRSAAVASLQITDRLGLMQGQLLCEIQEQRYFTSWGFRSFEEYIEGELKFKRRKAYYLINIYRKFVVELELDKIALLDLEWSKAKELVPVITKENADDLLDAIVGMTVSEVQALVKEMQADPSAVTEPDLNPDDEFTELKFTVSSTQRANINAALDMARKMVGSPKLGHCLDIMATDFQVGKITSGDEIDGEEALSRIDVHLKALERTFGVKLEVTEIANMPAYSKLTDGEEANDVTSVTGEAK